MALSHLFGIEPLEAAQILALLDRARELSTLERPPAPLAGRLVATLFFEASTRTRTSFEIAARKLGAEVASLSVATSSTSKGETLADTAQTLDAMRPDVVVVRHAASGVPLYLSRKIRAGIVNAGDGTHEHPTQALLDAFVLRSKLGELRGRKIVIVGDILHSRVARSNLFLLTKLGAEVHLAGPPSLCPPGFASLGAAGVHHDLSEALPGAHAVMALRLQRERMGKVFVSSTTEYFSRYGVTSARLDEARPGAFVMHPGPMNRGVEIEGALADSPRSVILDQVSAGIWTRMAVLEAICAAR